MRPENRKNRDTGWCGGHSQIAGICCPINSSDYFEFFLFVWKWVSESFPSLNLFHCNFGLYIKQLRPWFLVLKASKSRQNGKRSEWIPFMVFWRPERGKGGCHWIIKSFFLCSTVAFSDSFLDWGWQMGCIWNQVLVDQEEIRNVLIIEQSSQYSAIWRHYTSVFADLIYHLIKDNPLVTMCTAFWGWESSCHSIHSIS